MKFERDDRDIGKRALKAAAFLAGGRVIVRLFSLINLVVLARLLAPNDYGIAALAVTAIGMIQVFSDVRVNSALIALDDIDKTYLNTAFTISLIRGLIIGLGLFALAEPVAIFMEEPALTPVLRTLSIILIFDGLKNPGFLLYQRNVDFSKEFRRETLTVSISSIAAIAAAIYFRSYWAIVVGTIAGRLMSMLLTYYRIPFRPRFGLQHWREFFGFGGWLTFTGMVEQLVNLAPRLLIGKYVGAAPLGQYTLARELSGIATAELIGPISRTLFPSFSAIKDDRERLRRTFRTAQATLLGLALPTGLGLAMLSKEVILVLGGAKWLGSAVVLQIIAPVYSLVMLASATNSLAMTMRRVRSMFMRAALVAAVAWPAVYVGIELYGFIGGVIGVAVLHLSRFVFNLFFGAEMAGDHVLAPFVAGFRSIVSGAVMCLVLWLVPRDFDPTRSSGEQLLILVPYILLGAGVYIGTHLLLWRLAGYPDGVEQNLIYYGRMIRSKLRRRRG